jgi:hypothetical protein
MLENGKGELTDRFLRSAVNEVQGGYGFDQVPVFIDTLPGPQERLHRRGEERKNRFKRHDSTPSEP